MICPRCSTNVADILTFCPACGAATRAPQSPGVFAPAPNPYPQAMPGPGEYGYYNPEPSFLGLSAPGLRDGTALTQLMFVGGIALLAIFVLPWFWAEGMTFWSWTSLGRLGRGSGTASFILYFPLVAGLIMVGAARLEVPRQTRAALMLAVGGLPLVLILAKSMNLIPGGTGIMNIARGVGTVMLGVGITLRVLKRDTDPGRILICVGAALLVLGYVVPTKTGGFRGASHNLLWLSWKMLSEKHVQAGGRMLGFVMLLTPALALLSLTMVKKLGQHDPDPAQALGRVLAIFFVFWMPIMIGMATLVGLGGVRNSGIGGMILWVMLKIVVYASVVSLFMNNGAAALLHGDDQRAST